MGEPSVSTLVGYFLQDEQGTDASTFEYILIKDKCNLGLIDRTYPTDSENDASTRQWGRFARYVNDLNDNAHEDVAFKVLFLGRHGEGWHNVAQRKYGDAAWDNYWSLLEGDDSSNWSDALLTPTGREQAQTASQCFQEFIVSSSDQGNSKDTVTAMPQHFYVSPLARCLDTAHIEFARFHSTEDPSSPDRAFRPIVKELLREENGRHTCDRRSSKTWIQQNHPECVIEPSFTEEDELWSADVREPWDAHRERVAEVLRDIFGELQGGSDGSTEGIRRRKRETAFVSLTSHSGTMVRMSEVLGHRKFPVSPGGVLPVLVKVEWSKNDRGES